MFSEGSTSTKQWHWSPEQPVTFYRQESCCLLSSPHPVVFHFVESVFSLIFHTALLGEYCCFSLPSSKWDVENGCTGSRLVHPFPGCFFPPGSPNLV